MMSPGVVQVFHARHEIREATHRVEHAEAPLALAHQVVGAVGRGHVADDRRGRADPVQLVERRVLGLGVLLQQEPDLAFDAHGLLGACHRLLALDRDGQDHPGEQHEVADRQDDQHVIRQAGCLAGLSAVIRRRHGHLRCVVLVVVHVRAHGVVTCPWIHQRRASSSCRQPSARRWSTSAHCPGPSARRRSNRP